MLFMAIDTTECRILGVSHKISHLESLMDDPSTGTLVGDYYSYDALSYAIHDCYRIYAVPDDANTIAAEMDNVTGKCKIRTFDNLPTAELTLENEFDGPLEYRAMCGEVGLSLFNVRYGDVYC